MTIPVVRAASVMPAFTLLVNRWRETWSQLRPRELNETNLFKIEIIRLKAAIRRGTHSLRRLSFFQPR